MLTRCYAIIIASHHIRGTFVKIRKELLEFGEKFFDRYTGYGLMANADVRTNSGFSLQRYKLYPLQQLEDRTYNANSSHPVLNECLRFMYIAY